MNNKLAAMFAQLGQILVICPCCDDMFYLTQARPYLKGKQPKSLIDKLKAAERELDRQEQGLELIENDLRERAAKAGLRTAKALLKKIDSVFSGAGYDPQDVKVIFNPVTYVVFQGLAKDNLRKVRLLANPATSKYAERMHNSIDRAITAGNYEFKVLRVDAQGKVCSE